MSSYKHWNASVTDRINDKADTESRQLKKSIVYCAFTKLTWISTTNVMNIPNDHPEESILEQIKRLEELSAVSPADSSLRVELGQLYMTDGRLGDARNLFRKVLDEIEVKSSPELAVTCYNNLGQIALMLNQYETAISRLKSVLQIREAQGEKELIGQACYNLALAYWANREDNRAIDLLERSATFLPKATEVLTALSHAYGALKMRTNQLRTWARLSSIEAEEIVQISDNSSDLDKGQYHLARGMSLEFQGDYAGAVDEFEKAIEAGLVNTEIYWRLGICLSELERIREAIRALKKSIELDPSVAATITDLGVVYQKIGMIEMAAREYEHAISLSPSYMDTRLKLINLYLETSKPDSALICVNEALSIDDRDDRLYYLQEKAHLARGNILDGYRSLRKAMELVQDEKLALVYSDELKKLETRFAPSSIEKRGQALKRLLQGIQLREHGQLEDAIKQFEEACQLDPHFMEAQRELGLTFLDSNELAGAQRIFEEFVQNHPDNQDAQYGLGMVAVRMGNFLMAKQLLETAYKMSAHTPIGIKAGVQLTKLEVQEKWGSLPVQLYDESMALVNADQLEQAIDILREAATLAPNVALFNGTLGRLYIATDRLDAAFPLLRQAVKTAPEDLSYLNYLATALTKEEKFGEAIELLQKGISIDPTHWFLHHGLGICYSAIGNFVVAEAEFRKAIEQQPNQPDVRMNLAWNLLRQGKIGQAREELNDVATQFPDTSFAGNAIALLKQIDEETQSVLRAKEKTPDTDIVRQLLSEAQILFEAGYWDASIEKLQEAIAEDFDAFDPHFHLGNVYAKMRQYDQSVSEFEFAISLETTETKKADAYFNMANSYMKMSNLKLTAEMLRKAIEIYPGIRDARETLGLCRAISGNFDEAIRMVQEELVLFPSKQQSPIIHFNLGIWLLETGKDIEALCEIKKAILLNPKSGVFRERLGRFFLTKTLWNLAEAEYGKAAEAEPDDEQVRSFIEFTRFVEYVIPTKLVASDSPRLQHSLKIREELLSGRMKASVSADSLLVLEDIGGGHAKIHLAQE